ncbi:hypothetical protein KUCAC02_008110 [Chaenocephalus aceratus]|uniref:Uncharacterized protein n=1 Tax=Chaenocephalus aceratus TaxID=36190 RepID=A0ACB9X8D4_CHAAC|nr:hypothetical protein KUCAC02_008110 [Chaenocephalus aceratus]
MAHHAHPIPGNIYREMEPVPEDTPKIQGYDFNQGVDYRALMKSYLTTGLQATRWALAIQEINKMIERRQHR